MVRAYLIWFFTPGIPSSLKPPKEFPSGPGLKALWHCVYLFGETLFYVKYLISTRELRFVLWTLTTTALRDHDLWVLKHNTLWPNPSFKAGSKPQNT